MWLSPIERKCVVGPRHKRLMQFWSQNFVERLEVIGWNRGPFGLFRKCFHDRGKEIMESHFQGSNGFGIAI